MSRMLTRVTAAGTLALAGGCGNTTFIQQKALTEKVAPIISQLRQRQMDAAESRWALYAAAPVINAKVGSDELDGLARVLCAAPPRIPSEALDALDAFQSQLSALSKEPDASFSGYQQSITATRKTLSGLTSLGDYKARELQRKADADKAQADIIARGLNCETVLKQNFAVDVSAPDFGTDVRALGSVAVIQAVAALILKVEQIADKELRAAALRQYVSIYKSELAIALDQLDSSESQASSSLEPILRKTKEPANSRSAYASMLRTHLQYLERKALLLLRDAGNPSLPRTVNLQAAEAFAETATAHAKVLGSLTIADKTLASLRIWYWTYIQAIESGPESPGALLDALFAATKDLKSLEDLYGAFDKARTN